MGDGPIGNMVYLLENKGCIVSRVLLDADNLDAFSQWRFQEGRPYVVLGADKEAAARSRFDAAHELGHLVLHPNLDSVVLRKTAEFALLEAQAHKFAGAFLLPEARFCSEFRVPTLDALRMMKQKWKVSIGSMLMRARAGAFWSRIWPGADEWASLCWWRGGRGRVRSLRQR
jgi:Zn-dependent peptidase ImmA (M78 family)